MPNPRTSFRIRQSKNKGSANARERIVRAGLLAFGGILIVRLFILQVIDGKIYSALASQQREIYRELFPERGEVLIRDSKSGGLTPIATNKDLYLVYANPRLIADPVQTASKISPLLGSDRALDSECDGNATDSDPAQECADGYQEILNRLSKKDDPYEPLRHGVEETTVEEVRALNIDGIDAVRESVRSYPLKNIGSHIIGFVGADENGLAGRYGIESTFESELAGTQGYFEGEKDIAGRWIPVGRRNLEPAIDGATVVLTIDRTIQYFACTRLNEAVARYEAGGGAVVILEVSSGAVLAMCGTPDFDPNDYGSVENISIYNNPVIFDQYEPGSVFKVITMAAALDSGEVVPGTKYEDTGEVKIGSFAIRNSDNKAHGTSTMTEVLEGSLNTGAIFAARKTGMLRFKDYVARFGFGKAAGIELPNEAVGDIRALSERGEIYLATASFGQGITVTPLQMASAVGAIANQGKLMKPYIVSEVRDAGGVAHNTTEPEVRREVITPHTAALLSGMMVSVVEGSHGKRAGVPGYYVAGKTGTAQIPSADKRGYESGTNIGTFVGFAPVENPKFVMLTRIDRPQGVRFAESTAAPLFGEIADFLLKYFEIKPSRPLP